jgi:hypothetical protein
MSTINQEAPAAEAPKSKADFIKLPAYPNSDSYVAVVVATNYLPQAVFDRTDEKTGAKTQVVAPGIEFFFGSLVNGKAVFAKSWPKLYSINDRATYHKYYKAAVGKAPVAGSKPIDMVGKPVLLAIECQDKVSKKGTQYIVNKIVSVGSVPSVLLPAVPKLDALLPAFTDAINGGSNDNEPADGPF